MSKLEQLEKKLLHYVGKAIADYNLIQKNDRVMVCLSGGKDSFTLLHLLHLLRRRSNNKFAVFSYTLDQKQPGWDDRTLRTWLEQRGYPYEIATKDTYSIVTQKLSEEQTYCSLCSRLRRGTIYEYASRHGYTKIALGHHRDDLIQSLLMSLFYNGEIRSMPPKLLTDDKRNIMIRPLVYCQEKDIAAYAESQDFPIIPCNLCGSQDNLSRQRIKQLITELAEENPKIPSNMLHALQSIHPSQLMDKGQWDFKHLEAQRLAVAAGKDMEPLEGNSAAIPIEEIKHHLLGS
ncbi:MAG: tRNA 2-thiocytidine(32) synthetase TtcA [Gallionellales bacterium RBG_16_56_9]|nr:MAG: tRNA 2-thiocytidine(32) synthetase TtcA [Gallionellales bacterium RBG_16_56_9]